MAISFPLDFPTHKAPITVTIRQRKVVGMSEAPGSLVQQTYEWPGERWEGEFSLPPMLRPDGMRWASWLVSLRGKVGSFLAGDPLAKQPMGAAAYLPGTPQVDGNQSALARVLAIKTGNGPLANWLLAGSFLSLGTGSARRLHMVLRDASLASNGKATLEIWPALRAAVAADDTVALVNTTGRFMLTSQAEYRADQNGHFRPATFSFVEDLRA